tara:strand:+ start:182 stop:493 length:312 start_codon:yes stop_codon:yes gene_type:complete
MALSLLFSNGKKLKQPITKRHTKTWYVPYTTITVEMHKIEADTYNEAVQKANLRNRKGKVRTYTLQETHSTDAYLRPDVEDTSSLFDRFIHCFNISVKDFDNH